MKILNCGALSGFRFILAIFLISLTTRVIGQPHEDIVHYVGVRPLLKIALKGFTGVRQKKYMMGYLAYMANYYRAAWFKEGSGASNPLMYNGHRIRLAILQAPPTKGAELFFGYIDDVNWTQKVAEGTIHDFAYSISFAAHSWINMR